jgi:L-fuconolactonase
MYIDTHTHVITPDVANFPTAPLGGHQSSWSQERPVDAAGLLRAMDKSGVDKAVVVQASTVYGHDNRYVVETVAAHKDRLAGVFSADVLASDAVDQISRWLDAGLSGLRLFTTGSTMPGQAGWLDDPRSFPSWAFCEAHDIPVCLQMTADGIPMLRGLLKQFPKVRVLLDHLARPQLQDGPPYTLATTLFDLADEPGVYLKLTSRNLAGAASGKSTQKDFFAALLPRFGARRIAWGSNFPAAEEPLPEITQWARNALAPLEQEDRTAIFAGTALSLYPALRDTAHG